MTCKPYKREKFEIESWQETAIRKLDALKTQESYSIDVVKSSIEKYNNKQPIVLYSDGKDSVMTEHIVNMAMKELGRSDLRVIFSNTSLDTADTYKRIKERKYIEIINPDEGFYQWRERNQFVVSRFSRACCTVFKENSMIFQLDKNDKYLFFLGMRNEESRYRTDYVEEWRNEKWGDRDWQGILPIRKWTEEEIWLYIIHNNLSFNEKYRKGYARVGCGIVCPFATFSTWTLDKYWYPKMFDRWHKILEKDFINNFKWTRLNCTLKEYHTCWSGGLIRTEPTDEVIQEFANYKEIDFEVAKKYFNHTCKDCGKKVNGKDIIAMNLKLLGRSTETFYCKKHLVQFLNITNEEYQKYIEEFKQTGCELF